MTPLVLALSIVGALAVVGFLVTLILGLKRGFSHRSTRRILAVAVALGMVCAVLGVVIAFTSGG